MFENTVNNNSSANNVIVGQSATINKTKSKEEGLTNSEEPDNDPSGSFEALLKSTSSVIGMNESGAVNAPDAEEHISPNNISDDDYDDDDDSREGGADPAGEKTLLSMLSPPRPQTSKKVYSLTA